MRGKLFSGKKVGCAGIFVEDTFCGPMAEMPPEGRLVGLATMPTNAGGCAANVAINLAKQGVLVEVAGRVGNDSSGRALTELLKGHGIGTGKLLTSPSVATSRTVVLLVKGEDRRYLHFIGANGTFSASDLDREWLASLDVFYLGGFFALPTMEITALAEAFTFCRAHGVTTVLDVVIPKGASIGPLSELSPLLENTDYFLPNDDEAGALTGLDQINEQVAAFLEQGVGTVIVTCGENGAVAGRAGQLWHCDSHTTDCVDPSGAGDAFTSGVIFSILAGRELGALLAYASAIGFSATRAVGTTESVFNSQEAENFLAAHPLPIQSIALHPRHP